MYAMNILIDQYAIHVEPYPKTDSHQWIFTEASKFGI
jgi:hypothetical protein